MLTLEDNPKTSSFHHVMKLRCAILLGLVVTGFIWNNCASQTADNLPKHAATTKGAVTNSNSLSSIYPPRIPTNPLVGRTRIRHEHISDTVSRDGKTIITNRVPASVPQWREAPKAKAGPLITLTNKLEL